MKVYSYIVKRDYGFAPNPFGEFLTLATCKPNIRKHAEIGDYIIGNSTKEEDHKLIFMAEVSEILTFDSYWSDPRFRYKRPVMNGSVKKLYGDNIYHHDTNGNWIQEDSHHSLEGGKQNLLNLQHDTETTDKVLICSEFFYFGSNKIIFPDEFRSLICDHRGHNSNINDPELGKKLWDYINLNYPKKLIKLPGSFYNFDRYDGK